jgi:predicted N-formylglutamate amidohydrolase
MLAVITMPASDDPREHALSSDDPPPFQVERPAGTSPFFLTCDHASNQIPRRLGTLGVSEEDRARHIAWDIGIAGVARGLAERLDAIAILQGYSRLVIDANRPLGSRDSIVPRSDHTEVPGNHELPAGEAAWRAGAIFHPYHDRINRELDDRARAGRTTVLVAMHSFTPVMGGRARPWHAGVLYQRDARLGRLMLELLRAEPGLVVGDNEPYAVSDDTDYTLVVHGERRGLPHVELELRQDLIADDAGQAAWAARLATLLERAWRMFPR